MLNEALPGAPQLPDNELDLLSPRLIQNGFAYELSRGITGENNFAVDNYLALPSYELSGTRMEIYDVVWGKCSIDAEASKFDDLLLKLARTPLFRRLQSIEQLTLGENYATMPNTMQFSRWQHVWGSLIFVRKMTEGLPMASHEREVLQLRTLLSDAGHTAFSHMGDWLFQGSGGKEDLHDQELREMLITSGIAELFHAYGYTLNEIVFPNVADWVEYPPPDLCVDRVDYGLREMLRWCAPTIPLHTYLKKLQNPKNLFAIDDQNRLTITDPTFAKLFAAGYSILPTEHWSHPVHRLQLELLQMAVRGAVVSSLENYDSHPREVLYGVDADFEPAFNRWPHMRLHKILKDIARTQRQIFITGRRYDLNAVFGDIQGCEWKFPNFPDPLTSYSWESKELDGPYPPNVIIEPAPRKVSPLTVSSRGLTLYLPALKARTIDPLVAGQDGPEPLSAREPSYNQYLQGQRAVMAASHLATICMRPEVAQHIVADDRKVRKAWRQQLSRPRDPEKLREIIQETQYLAAGTRFDHITEV